jgi:hypothetical protein
MPYEKRELSAEILTRISISPGGHLFAGMPYKKKGRKKIKS